LSVIAANPKKCIDKRRYEIIGGKKYMPPSASANHGSIVSNLNYIFRSLLIDKDFRCYADIDVVFDSENTVRPDFKIIGDISKIAGGKNIQGAPDFIAEVLSPSNSAHDLVTKKNLYQKHGVREYWIVDINSRNVHVYLLNDENLYGDPSIYHSFTEEEAQDILNGYDDEDKELIKITEIKTHTFGGEIRVPMSKIFENLI
jgi:Uma2 family endonuclease